MNKVVVLPKSLKPLMPFLSHNYYDLFCLLRDKCDYSIVFKDEIKNLVNSNGTLFIFAGAQGKHLLNQISSVNNKTKVVIYLGGPHNYSKNQKAIRAAFDRADIILCGSKQLFKSMWPGYMDKYVFFPNFFSPHSRYMRLSLNENPTMKCLFTGSSSPAIYPIRAFVKHKAMTDDKSKTLIDYMRHPRWGGKSPLAKNELSPWQNHDYALILNSYFCSLATSSRFKYALSKYFEITAAGSLLLADPATDVFDAGLISGKHFVPIDKKNVLDVIEHCLKNPDRYEVIRWRGMVHTRRNHSVVNRFDFLRSLLDEL